MADPVSIGTLVAAGASLITSLATLLHQMTISNTWCCCSCNVDLENNQQQQPLQPSTQKTMNAPIS